MNLLCIAFGKKMLPRVVELVPVSRFEFERIYLTINSLLANQPVASELERARDQVQS